MNLLTRQLDLNFFFLPCDSVKFISDHPEILLLVDIMVMMLEIKDIEESFYLPDLGEFWVFRVCPVRCADGLCDDCEKKKIIPSKFSPQTSEHRLVYPTNIPTQITMLDL